jgi:hypothetical protein
VIISQSDSPHSAVRRSKVRRYGRCKVFMRSFIVVRFPFFVVIFNVVFRGVAVVEVRLRASSSAPKRTPVANDAPALFSGSSCFSFDNNKTPKQ